MHHNIFWWIRRNQTPSTILECVDFIRHGLTSMRKFKWSDEGGFQWSRERMFGSGKSLGTWGLNIWFLDLVNVLYSKLTWVTSWIPTSSKKENELLKLKFFNMGVDTLDLIENVTYKIWCPSKCHDVNHKKSHHYPHVIEWIFMPRSLNIPWGKECTMNFNYIKTWNYSSCWL